MKQAGFNKFECCGRQLARKFKMCPECGEIIPRAYPPDVLQVLTDLDTKARRNETTARNALDKMHEKEAIFEEAECLNDHHRMFVDGWGIQNHGKCGAHGDQSCIKCAAWRAYEYHERIVKQHTNKGLWHRSLMRMIETLFLNQKEL